MAIKNRTQTTALFGEQERMHTSTTDHARISFEVALRRNAADGPIPPIAFSRIRARHRAARNVCEMAA
jgi:hypothetical protein